MKPTTSKVCMMAGRSASTPDPHTSRPLPPQRERRAVLVVDLVESVRLMQAHEFDVIERWRRFVEEVRSDILPVHKGRMVKSLGDGMLLAFETVPQAAAAAFRAHACIEQGNPGREPDALMLLRAGLHVADLVVDELDLYGMGVNVAARIAALGQA